MVDFGHLLEAKIIGDFFGKGLPGPLETTLGRSRGQDTWVVLTTAQLHWPETGKLRSCLNYNGTMQT